MKAMLLAAGLGTRLGPITQWIPKPMLPIFGVPIIELNLRQLREQGVREVLINIHHMPVKIVQHVKDGGAFGVKVHYSLEPAIMGTAGGLKKVEEQLQDETFLVINADTYRDWDLEALMIHHQAKHRILTLLLQENPGLSPERAVGLDEKGDVVRFLGMYERPGAQGVPCDFLGVQAMEPEVLALIPNDQPWEIHRVLVSLLTAGQRVGGARHSGYWRDLGTLAGYLRIHWDTLDGTCPIRIPAAQREPGVWIEDGVRLEPAARIEPPVFLGRGSRVAGMARVGPHAVLGEHSVVERGAAVERSILWEGARIQENVVIRDAVVGREFRCSLPLANRVEP